MEVAVDQTVMIKIKTSDRRPSVWFPTERLLIFLQMDFENGEVRFGVQKTEVAALRRDVCFTPVSGHRGRDYRGDDVARTVADLPRSVAGSFGACHPPGGPRDRTPSAYLQFSFFVFRLANPLFKGNANAAHRSGFGNSGRLGAAR